MGMLKVLDSSGHGQFDYRPDVAAELEAARDRFADLRRRGFQAFVVEAEGDGARFTGDLVPAAFEHIFLRPLVGG